MLKILRLPMTAPMPELPEVEISCRGIAPTLQNQTILGATCRTPKLRWPLDPGLPSILSGRRIISVKRRAKYILVECQAEHSHTGWLIIHLGMSGSLRILPSTTQEQTLTTHDHFDLILPQKVLRYRDPRRFGSLLWHAEADIETHPLLRQLGPEPLSPYFNGSGLHSALFKRTSPIKPVLMDSQLVVGIGNIYAAESLFRAGISPLRAANKINRNDCDQLVLHIQQTLEAAIAAGGSSVRDYVHSDGGIGCFQLESAVYNRAGMPCLRCGASIQKIRQTGRSTFYCASCQH